MGLLGKKWPVPVASPMAPFFAAGVIIAYGINSFQTAMYNAPDYKNDPRNPNSKSSNGN